MTMQVIGVGVGRTGTYSLKLAINQLGLGPCHHMEEVLHNQAEQVPLWAAAVRGYANWEAIYNGYQSAVDWPTVGFFRELLVAFPSAKYVLTVRTPESWVESFSQTIYKLVAGGTIVPEAMQQWLDMAAGVISKTGFSPGLDVPALKNAFNTHNVAVKASIPANQLLVYQVKDGWEPLCKFLKKPIPVDPFPRTNDRSEFWDRVSGRK